ncbi:MAG TPA: H-type lectin domain-containing protein [Polyangiaceae bacterium]|nr:H-type lectin domain-containing protein [Polyangiaceae bacterium]
MSGAVLPLSFAAGAVRFDDSQPGWGLLERAPDGEGVRSFTGRVRFDRAFQAPPVVQIGITGFDIDNGDNARLNVGIRDVDVEGFAVELRTWWNSRLWSVDLNWIAIGH